ncbi:probable peptidase M16 family protein [gamma proteobacterium HdN1]|nr:probable peptidase M16 family protein [gamma proteobacterium HdN1]
MTAPSSSDRNQKRADDRRKIIRLLAFFTSILTLLVVLYSLKPTRQESLATAHAVNSAAHSNAPSQATGTTDAAAGATNAAAGNLPTRELLSSERLIQEAAPRKQDIDIQSWKTPKGAKVMFVEADEVPMLDVRLVFNAGAARDDKLPGLAAITNSLLDEGTPSANVDEIARQLESIGASIGLGSYRDMAIISLRTLTDPAYLDKALALLYDVSAHPSFPAESLSRIRQQMLVGLEAEKQRPEATLNRVFYSVLYAGHPYGIPPSGTPESLKAITASDIAAFHSRYYVASNLVIAITGAIDREKANQIASAIDNALPQGEPAPALPVPKGATASQEIRLPFASSQTHIVVGGLSVDRRTPDWAALYVGNEILGGGGFASRLNQIIRQDNGLAYSVYSSISPMAQAGPFTMGLQTSNETADQALALVNSTFKKFIAEGPTEQELEATKKNILGGLPLSTANNRAIVDQLGAMAFYDLPLDYLKTLPEKIAAVTLADVRNAFAKDIASHAQITLMVGGRAVPTIPASRAAAHSHSQEPKAP